MSYVGYEWLRQRLSLSAFEMDRPARVRPVTRVMPAEGLLAVPAHGSDLRLRHSASPSLARRR